MLVRCFGHSDVKLTTTGGTCSLGVSREGGLRTAAQNGVQNNLRNEEAVDESGVEECGETSPGVEVKSRGARGSQDAWLLRTRTSNVK